MTENFELHRGSMKISINMDYLREVIEGDHNSIADCITVSDIKRAAKHFGLRISLVNDKPEDRLRTKIEEASKRSSVNSLRQTVWIIEETP